MPEPPPPIPQRPIYGPTTMHSPGRGVRWSDVVAEMQRDAEDGHSAAEPEEVDLVELNPEVPVSPWFMRWAC